MQQRVAQREGAGDVALGRVGEQHRAALEAHVLAAQGREPERAVLVVVAGRVLLAAGAEDPDVQHPHRAGEHPVSAQARLAEPPDDLLAHVGERRPRG